MRSEIITKRIYIEMLRCRQTGWIVFHKKDPMNKQTTLKIVCSTAL